MPQELFQGSEFVLKILVNTEDQYFLLLGKP